MHARGQIPLANAALAKLVEAVVPAIHQRAEEDGAAFFVPARGRTLGSVTLSDAAGRGNGKQPGVR